MMNPTSSNPRLSLVADGLSWPESPRWWDDALWFSDVHNFRLMKLRPGERAQCVAQVPGRPAGLGFMPDGRLLLATALDKKLWWVSKTGELDLALDLSAQAEGPLNDMVVDRTGRAWVGETGFDLLKGEKERPGTLFSWMPGGVPQAAANDVLFPNGIAISEDHQTLYLSETFGNRISAFDMRPDGTLSNQRTHALLEGRPDGLCLDVEGGLWIALLWQQEFHRIDRSGHITNRIKLDGERAISCVLAGPERKDLFLGTAAINDEDKNNVQRYGFIKHVVASIAGAGIP